MAAPRFSVNSLLVRLLVAYLLPTLALFALFGLLAAQVTERSLADSLGRRLIGIAQAAATQVRPEAIAFLGPGDDRSRTAVRTQHKLRLIRDRTRVARVFILDKELGSRSDTQDGVRIGDRYYHAEADRSELELVFAGKEASSVLFSGDDGRYYKTGYAPIRADGRVIAALGVEGSAEFFQTLDRLRAYVVVSGAVVAALVILVSLLVARRITGPLRTLAREASRIGAGELEQPIALGHGRDEVGLLATTLNEMRNDLFLRDQQLQMMLSGIAHEVRNPLGGIALFAGMLREDLADNPELLEMVERIERELEYLKKVVGEFLDFARRTPPRLRTLSPASLVEQVAQVLQADAAAAGVELQSAAEEVTVEGDPEQLRRLLLNLGRNALQATPSGGRIWLRCATERGAPYLEVEDTGGGIPEELLERVFTPFFTTREKGTGLGLALSKKIAEDHGGQIEVHSGSAGTRIRVRLRRGSGSVSDGAADKAAPDTDRGDGQG